MFSQIQLENINKTRKSFNLIKNDLRHFTQFDRKSFQTCNDQTPVEQQQLEISNKSMKQSEGSYQLEFQKYSKDIKEVRSLVNLWKEEFIRRKSKGLPELEKA